VELIAFLLRVFNAETQRRRVRRVLFSRVEHVDRVEILHRLFDLIHQSYNVHRQSKNVCHQL